MSLSLIWNRGPDQALVVMEVQQFRERIMVVYADPVHSSRLLQQ